MKFKVGDKIIGNEKANKYSVTKEGTVWTVDRVCDNGIYVSGTCYSDLWCSDYEDCFDLYKKGVKQKEIYIADKIEIEKIIFNKPATILYANGKRYVSKAYNEEFDEEKGLLMCLIKTFGISHLELQRMIKGATTQTKKEATKKTKEEAKKKSL